jgi:hypothetical protein
MDKNMENRYPIAMRLDNIRKEKRVCSICGSHLCGYGYCMFTAVSRGKYLCRKCDADNSGQRRNPLYG